MVAQGRLQGIFTPNMVPLDQEGKVCEAELRRYVDWMIDRGVHGLYPNGSTSEFTRFTPEERRRIIEITVDQAAGRVPVLAGAAEANVRETLRACEHYHRLGVRAVAIVSPYYYKLRPDNVYAYFKEIGRNTPVDVTLYNIPMFASPIDVPTIQRLSEECERIVAIKDSSGDLPQMMRMIEAVRPNRPDFSFLTGWDPVLMPMLLIGCDGGTNATSGITPELTRKLYDLPVTVALPPATDIAPTSTRIPFEVAGVGSGATIQLFYGPTDCLTFADRWSRSEKAVTVKTGRGHIPLNGLKPGTEYFYRALLRDDACQVWSFSTRRFHTPLRQPTE